MQHFQSIWYGQSIAEMHNDAQKITPGSRIIIARFTWKYQTIWERIIIACKQTLPVIHRLTSANERNTCLKCSTFRRSVMTLKLTTHMRAQLQNDRLIAGNWEWKGAS